MTSREPPAADFGQAYDDSLFCHDLPTLPRPELGTILVTGASGYIGGRLVPELFARGYRVRVMVRADPAVYRARWPQAEAVEADALKPESLGPALAGIHTAYYLIHSLLLGPREFEVADQTAAANFRVAAEAAQVQRIIYLGGLGDFTESQSPHLRNRMEVARELGRGAVPVTFLRAAIIIGSGSASYEMIRHLVGSLPVILIPRWAKNLCHPIAIRDVIKYLVGVLETPATAGRSFDIGGQDVLSYEQMLRGFADVIHKKILFFDSPFSPMRWFAFLASLLTPVPLAITSCLMEGLKDEVVCRNDEIKELVPFLPMSYREAIVRALSREEQDQVATRWSDAYPPAHELAIKLYELKGGPAYSVSYSLATDKDADRLFAAVCRVGGIAGWFNTNLLWRIRGMADRLLFGVGTSRGRKSQSTLEPNDVIDFWRVEDLVPRRRLLLRSEMKMPGLAWLEFTITPQNGRRLLAVTAHYHTHTLLGKIYWFIFLPFHGLIFNDLIRQLEKRA